MKQPQTSIQSLTELLASGAVVVTTSAELSAPEKKLAEAAIHERSNVESRVVYKIDPQVLGGIRIQSADWFVDLTLKEQLTALAASLKV